jgi:hypothetical protein
VAATEQIHTSRAVEELLGSERFSLLRARYAELQARISERREDPAKLEEWRRQAERLNPDTWVTVDEAKAALERYEADFETLHIALGRRRRRSRRGGARRTRRRRAAVARSAEQQGAQSSPSEASAEPGSVAGERPDDDHEV